MTDQPTLPIAPPVALDAGATVLGRYRLERPLGTGGMGTVWQAHDTALTRDVAIKIVRLVDALTSARFVREGRLAARLDHRGLARIYDVGQADGLGFLVMELLGGRTLFTPGPLTVERILWVGSEVGHAMAYAHAAGLVHRDLKPDNLFLDERGPAPRVVVIDFGLSFALGADRALGRLTRPDVAGGTPGYMSPEQARAADLTSAADVYALGCVLFELCAQRPPFEGSAALVMSKHVYAAPPSLHVLAPELPAAVVLLVSSMLHKQPGDRPTMAEVAAACDRLRSPHAPTAWPPLGLGRGKLAEDRAHRMVTRVETASAVPDGPAIGSAAVIGAIEDDVLIALATIGIAARRAVDASGADIVLADAGEAQLALLVASGRPVIAVADAGDLDRAMALARLGAVDVLTRPIQPDAAARKLERALRRTKPRSPA